LAIDERLVSDVAQASPVDVDFELAGSRRCKTGAKAKECRLPGPVRPGDDEESVACDVERDSAQDTFVPVPLLQPPSPDHGSHSSPTARSSSAMAPGAKAGDCPQTRPVGTWRNCSFGPWSSCQECDEVSTRAA